MSQFRKDPIIDRWVIIAPERAGKPEELVQEARVGDVADCPFCEHQESVTTSEILAFRDPQTAANEPGWHARVIANKYPAVKIQETPDPQTDHQASGYGVHDVIIECPHHETDLGRLSAEHIAEVLSLYRDRLSDLASDPRLAYGLIFKNSGALAGASIEHAHSQLVATPAVPPTVAEEIASAEKFHQGNDQCIFCDLLDRERADGSRVVFETPSYLILSPYAARFAFEMWLFPKKHAAQFSMITPNEAAELGEALKTALGKIGSALNYPAYNYYLHTAPLRNNDWPHYHWHLEIFPRLTQLAGFEHGTGLFINPVQPEQAAEILRNVTVD